MLNFAQQYGEFLTITIENMSEEHHNIEHGNVATDMESNIARAKEEKEKQNTPLKEYALIAVSSGSGLDEMFKELGVDVLVQGGQTMNPSTADFLDAIKKAHAKTCYILPNNSNIVLAAKQAADVVMEEGENKAYVIHAKSIPQGFNAIMQFSPDNDPETNFDMMKAALKNVASGSVTYAIKDTDIEGVHITKDYYMAMRDDKKVAACVPDKFQALKELINSLATPDTAVFTIIAGEDVKDEEIAPLQEELQNEYPDVEINIFSGKQPIYSFLVGAE